MKRPFRFLAGLAITLIGAYWLLLIAAFCSMIDPTLPERDWWLEFLERFTAAGLAISIIPAWGIYLVITSWEKVLPRIRWRQERDPDRPTLPGTTGVWDREFDVNP